MVAPVVVAVSVTALSVEVKLVSGSVANAITLLGSTNKGVSLPTRNATLGAAELLMQMSMPSSSSVVQTI
jgi:hypothetical protein